MFGLDQYTQPGQSALSRMAVEKLTLGDLNTALPFDVDTFPQSIQIEGPTKWRCLEIGYGQALLGNAEATFALRGGSNQGVGVCASVVFLIHK